MVSVAKCAQAVSGPGQSCGCGLHAIAAPWVGEPEVLGKNKEAESISPQTSGGGDESRATSQNPGVDTLGELC